MNVLLLTEFPGEWEKNIQVLKGKNIDIMVVRSAKEAAAMLRVNPPLMVLFDASGLSIKALRTEVIRLLTANAMVNIAVASSIPAHEFHDLTEGLGILMQISREKLLLQIDSLLDALRTVTNASGQTSMNGYLK